MIVIMQNPRVSVIIPSHQCDRYISQAIDSVLSQTHCAYELLIIDDGSTDRTREIVASYGHSSLGVNANNKLRYYYQENQGVCAARNRGLELARGKLIVFLDADDYFLPNKLVEHVAVFEANPVLGLVHSGWQRVDSDGNFLQDVRLWESISTLNLENWLRFKPVLPSAMMFRRTWLERIGGFDPNYKVAEDVDLILRLSLEGCQAAWLQQVTVAYRQHPSNTMSDGLAQARDVQQVMNNFFDHPKLPEHIKLIEKNVRYNTLVWIACYLYQTGHQDKMIQHLKLSYDLSPYLPIETVINWVESLVEFSNTNDWGLDVNHLANSQDWQRLLKWVLA